MSISARGCRGATVYFYATFADIFQSSDSAAPIAGDQNMVVSEAKLSRLLLLRGVEQCRD
jgi:hypothetical protein